MFLQGPQRFFFLGTVFLLQDVLGICERPAWSRVAWDMTPQDLEQLMTKEQSNYLHTSMCQICHCFTGMGLSKGCLEVLYASCTVALFIIVGLSMHYLLPKLKLVKKTKSCQAMIQTPAVSITTEVNDEYTHHSMNKMLCRLVTNTSKMMKYMKCVAHHQKKELKYHKLSKRRKGDETDEDEQLFPICPYNHSSSGYTIMHET